MSCVALIEQVFFNLWKYFGSTLPRWKCEGDQRVLEVPLKVFSLYLQDFFMIHGFGQLILTFFYDFYETFLMRA